VDRSAFLEDLAAHGICDPPGVAAAVRRYSPARGQGSTRP
jgi:hypothetical protein